MKKTLVLVSMAVVVAVLVAGLSGAFGTSSTPAVYASRLAGIASAGVTGIQVQNLDASQPATIVADFYNQRGGPPTAISLPATAAGAAANIYLPNRTELANGAYAAIISADRQIAAIARTDWNSSGGAAIYSNVLPSTDVALALAVKGYFGQTSLVSIQNTDPNAQANVEVRLYKVGETTPTKTVNLSISQGTSTTIDLAKDPNFIDVPSGFLGSMRVTSATQIGVQSFVDIETSAKAVYAFEGVPSEMAAPKLYAPLFRAGQKGVGATDHLDTGISVVNPGATAVDVTVRYIGTGNACAGQNFTHGPSQIAAGSSAVFYQGPGSCSLPTGCNGLPDNCYGSAVIEATGGNVLAIVNDSLNFTVNSAAYNAVNDAQGAMKVALPLFRRAHVGLTTGIQAMNIGSGTANVTITFTKADGTVIAGCGGQCTATVPANSSANWWPGSISSITDGTYGSAVIESDQPLAVIVNDFSISGATDAATYNGIKADVQ
jgi:hypothetical protein